MTYVYFNELHCSEKMFNPSLFQFIFTVPHSCQFQYKKNKAKTTNVNCKLMTLLKRMEI